MSIGTHARPEVSSKLAPNWSNTWSVTGALIETGIQPSTLAAQDRNPINVDSTG